MALYLEHFGITEPPFRITPHTDFFFDGADRGATLDALLYAVVHDEGIVKVSGEVGSGKTMLCRVLMERLPAQVETVYVATPALGTDEIVHAIADELDLKLAGGGRMSYALRELQEQLIRLYAAGRRAVVLIDEAHVMPDESLEQVRLLSNLESNRHKLLQIVLFGQPELDATLAKPSLRQLRDRITHSFRMRPLTPAEVNTYVSFRMRAAGYRGPEVFQPRALALLARASSGLTRRINILADKALLAAYSENTHGVTARHVKAAIADSEFASVRRAPRLAWIGAGALALSAALGAGVQWMLTSGSVAKVPETVRPSAAPAAPVSTPSAAPAAVQPASPASGATATDQPPVAAEPATDPKVAESKPVAEPRPAESEGPSIPVRKELSAAQQRRFTGLGSKAQGLLTARMRSSLELVQLAPDEAWSIELYVTDNLDPARMERFLMRARELVPLQEVFILPMTESGRPRLRVVYGLYASRDAALEGGRRLPPKYQQAFQTVPRTFAELRNQL